MTGLVVKIVLALAALAYGIYLGLPGRYTQTPEDIEEVMASGGARRRKVRRRFTPLAWVQRNVSSRGSGGHDRGRSGFRLKSPEDR